MKPVLFLNGKYIGSKDELISNAMAAITSSDAKYQPQQDQLLSLVRDGVVGEWLKASGYTGAEEIDLLNTQNLSDSQLKVALGKLWGQSRFEHKSPDFSKYLEFLPEYKVINLENGKETKVPIHASITIAKSTNREIEICVKVSKPANEIITLELCKLRDSSGDSKEIRSDLIDKKSFKVDLRKKGETYFLRYNISDLENIRQIILSNEGKTLRIFEIVNPLDGKLFVFDDACKKYFTIYKLNGHKEFDSKFELLMEQPEWICATNEMKNKLFFFTGSKNSKLGFFNENYKLEIYHKHRLKIFDEEKVVGDFCIIDSIISRTETFFKEYARKRNLNYYTLGTSFNYQIKSVDGSQNLSLKGYEDCYYLPINIGKKFGKDLFFIKKNISSESFGVVDINGNLIYARNQYNGGCIPIGKDKFLISNSGSKYSKFDVFNIDGTLHKEFRVQPHIYLHHHADTDTSYIINEYLRYLKASEKMISTLPINDSFYIKEGEFHEGISKNNFFRCSPELYNAKTDSSLLRLSNTSFVNLGNDMVAVIKEGDTNFVVVSTKGEIIYRLKKDETLFFNHKILSPKNIVVKAGKDHIRIYNFARNKIGDFNLDIKDKPFNLFNPERILGFINNKLFIQRKDTVVYYDLEGNSYFICKINNTFDDPSSINNIELLPNGFLLIKDSKNKYILLNHSGEEIIKAPFIKYLTGTQTL